MAFAEHLDAGNAGAGAEIVHHPRVADALTNHRGACCSDLIHTDRRLGIIDHMRADPFVQSANLFTVSQCLHFSDQFVCGRIGSGPVHFVSVDRIALLTGILDRQRDAVCDADQQIFKLLPVAIDVIMDSSRAREITIGDAGENKVCRVIGFPCVGLGEHIGISVLAVIQRICIFVLFRRTFRRRRSFAGVGLVALNFHRAIPVDIEANGFADVSELHVVVAADVVCLQINADAVHIDTLNAAFRQYSRSSLSCRRCQRRPDKEACEEQKCCFLHVEKPPFRF